MIDVKKIRAYALKNAIEHNGKANPGAVLNPLFVEGLQKSEIKDAMPIINDIVEKVNSLSSEKQEKLFEEFEELIKRREVREGLPDLPEAENGKVVMRLAPFPSGPLHIGNARPYILNDEYVKTYSGKLILIIDDTISGENKPVEKEAYNLIPAGFDWLKINYDKKIVYKSDRNEIYYKYSEELLKKGYLYVCSCPQETFQELKKNKKECPCRNLSENENLKRWKQMFDKSTNPGELVVRLKTSMQDPDPAFRDRVMFRISDREHPKVGKKYRVWPSLEFSWAIDDHLLGMTHILRGVDLMIETKVEKFIWDIFKWKHPDVIHTGFLRIEGVKISKSKGAKEVKSGTYIGWNDPRLWSLQSLKDRGIKPEAIRDFVLSMGITKANTAVSVDILYAINRKYLEKAPRYFFIEDPVKIHIAGSPKINAKLPLHPSENLGQREYKTEQDFYITKADFELMENKDYRLMHLLNFKSEQISAVKPRTFSFMSSETDEKLKVKYLHWLPANLDNMKVQIRMPDNEIIKGLGEPELKNLKIGEVVQFERFGFCCLNKLDKKENSAEFWFTHR